MKALKYFDLGVKLEVVLHEMHYTLFVTSNIECWLFLFGVIFSAKIPGMGAVWMFLPHVIRGIIGILLWRRLPKSHDIVKQLGFDKEYDPDDENTEFQDGESKMGFDTVHQRVKLNMEKLFFETYAKCQHQLKAYIGLTIFSYIMDLMAFIIVIRYYGEPGQEYAEMTLMAIVTIFLFTNIYWMGQVLLLNFKFPDYIAKYMQQAFFASGAGMSQKLKHWANKSHEKMGRTAKRMKDKMNKE